MSNPTPRDDARRARAAAEIAATPAFRDTLAAVQALYDPARQAEPLDDALRCVVVTMTALEPKAALALKVAERAIGEAAAAAALAAPED